MKSVFIDVQSHQVKVVDIEDKLEVFYEMIGCTLVEIPRRYIGKKLYSVICDEEATFVEDPIPSMIDEEGKILLLGNLIVCGNVDDEGNLTSLTDEDVERILWNIAGGSTEKHKDLFPLLVGSYDYEEV